eukprot:scpid66109/ scgid25978/ 
MAHQLDPLSLAFLAFAMLLLVSGHMVNGSSNVGDDLVGTLDEVDWEKRPPGADGIDTRRDGEGSSDVGDDLPDKVDREKRQYNADYGDSIDAGGNGESYPAFVYARDLRRLKTKVASLEKQFKSESHRLSQNVINSFPMSCKDVQKFEDNANLPSGYYMILSHKGTIVKVYCEMERYGGGWTRIAYINPREQQQCPGTMRYQDLEVPLCTKPTHQSGFCSLATFHALPGEYSEVMGFVTGYRHNSLDAFARVDGATQTISLDDWYTDGISITHGSPKRHLWTYTASYDDHRVDYHCPCSPQPGPAPPSFVGSDYYCADSGTIWRPWTLTPAAHAWSNTSQCTAGGTCCDNTDMPWFHRQLDTYTSDPVQIRLCTDQANADENVGIDQASIFVR